MQCLVSVKFLEGGSLSPEEFFTRVGTRWSWVDYIPTEASKRAGNHNPSGYRPKAREAICIADYDSVEQLTINLAIMPGAGISNVEVYPISGNHELQGLQAAPQPVSGSYHQLAETYPADVEQIQETGMDAGNSRSFI